jgi:hypothetical protein
LTNWTVGCRPANTTLIDTADKQVTCTPGTIRQPRAWLGAVTFLVPGHTDALVRSALAADASLRICGVGAVLGVGLAGCRQGGLQRLRPLLIGPGQSPHLIGSQAKISQYLPERLAAIDRIEELQPYLGWEPLVRSGSSTGPQVVAVRPPTEGAVTPAVPPRICAVRGPPHSRERRLPTSVCAASLSMSHRATVRPVCASLTGSRGG